MFKAILLQQTDDKKTRAELVARSRELARRHLKNAKPLICQP